MGSGQTRATVVVPTVHPRPTGAPVFATSLAWESRVYAGLRLRAVPQETRTALVAILGEIGVEAEHFLTLEATFPGNTPPSRALADMFLLRMESSARRLCAGAAALEIATQSYLSALEAIDPSLRSPREAERVWWTESAGGASSATPLELRLRACRYAYRHVVAARLASNVEAIVEQLTLILHAMGALPPAGILPLHVLYGGLYSLSSMLQGYLVPNHITSVNQELPGLFSSIARLRLLASVEDTSIESDLVWARSQYTRASQLQLSLPGGTGQGAAQWARSAAGEWLECIRALETIR